MRGKVREKMRETIRQGNENEEVAIYRYVTKGTFDAYNLSLIHILMKTCVMRRRFL